MNTQNSMVHVRIDSELKRQATEALASMGLTASDWHIAMHLGGFHSIAYASIGRSRSWITSR